METIQRADPKARRKAIKIICIATILGIVAILAFEYVHDDFQSWLEKNIYFFLEHPLVVFVVFLVLVSPVLAAGGYLYLVGKRTVRAQRFPPPGYAVAGDTLVLEGGQAMRRGRAGTALEGLLFVSNNADGSARFSTRFIDGERGQSTDIRSRRRTGLALAAQDAGFSRSVKLRERKATICSD